MKPLRVTMIAQRFWPRVGAVETRAAQLACELADRGNEVTVVTARWHVEWPAEIHFRSVPVVRIGPPPQGAISAWRWERALLRWLKRNTDQIDVVLVWGMMREARAAIRAFGPLADASDFNCLADVSHSNNLPDASASSCDREARRGTRLQDSERAKYPSDAEHRIRRIPVVLVPERTGWQGDCFRQARAVGGKRLQRTCRQAAAFVATSPAARRELEAAGYPRERIFDSPPGVPLFPPRTAETQSAAREMLAEANSVLRLAVHAPLVVSTTRLEADRGWQCLLAAWSIVARKRPAARLWLAGEAPQVAKVAARINTSGIAASVGIVGKFDDVSQLLAAADVHVSAAPDGSPQSVLEAMAAAVPTVAADVPLNRWLLADPPAGRLVPAADAASLAAAMMGLLENAEEAQRLGAAGQQRAQRDFRLAGMVDGFCDVLDRVRLRYTPR